MSHNDGFITIQTLAVIFLISIIGAGSFLFINDIFTRIRIKTTVTKSYETEFTEIIKTVIDSMEKDETPQVDSPFDFYFFTREENNITTVISDISSAINPNWIRKQPFQETQLKNLLIDGVSADSLQQYREDYGFSLDIENFYNFFFSEYDCNKYLTAWSYANVNNSDEFSLRSLYARITGDTSRAELFHAKIQDLLINQKMVKEPDLTAFFGIDADQLSGVMTARPQWNVNFLDPLILSAILSYPGYKIQSPEKKAEQIIAKRESGEVSFQSLVDICGLKEDHPLFSYLGCETFFWRVTIKNASNTMIFILARDLKAPKEQKKIKVVSMEFNE